MIENTPDGRPVIERLPPPDNVVVATMSSVGFGLSPASGHAIRDLVLDGACSFADISIVQAVALRASWSRTGASCRAGRRWPRKRRSRPDRACHA